MNTPCYVIDSDALRRNLSVLQGVTQRTGAHILLAQKAFSCYALYPMIGQYLCGATASGLYEARLCHEEMPGGENHVFSPAFKAEDVDELVDICDHIVFNSLRQLSLYGAKAREAGCSVGLRINPEKSTQEGHAIYDPCAPGSRMGVTAAELETAMVSQPELLTMIDGLHFHTLCEQDSDALEVTLDAVVEKFGHYLKSMKWINFGGGHHITREGYDIKRLERCIMKMREEYGLEVYLEPGEAVALNAGFLHTRVLEIQNRESGRIAILDTSAACHMPDVLEMPYRPPLQGSGCPDEKPFSYRLAGPTCLAGDVIGDYSFDYELKEGEMLTFCDMAIYSMVKNNTFNGMPLPSIWIKDGDRMSLWKEFGYKDFKNRV
ncbi:MAG: carboxynorspermidine decarboxylase [Bacteroidales bacterium]|nr:carboxynorspermidine decarboxylase [Candidatus Cryptobacteroides onthequi]